MRFTSWFAGFAVLSAVAVAACGGDDGGDGPFGTPRGLSLAPDGRLIVADAGTGDDDGRVLALTLPSLLTDGDLEPSATEVLLEGLPSRDGALRGDGPAGPVAAAMAEDGVVCVVISAAEDAPGEMRCSDGLVVDLAAFEVERNPDGRGVASDPAGIAADGTRGWFVSDRAANSVLFIDRAGAITVVAVFAGIEGLPDEAHPLGLYAIQGTTGPLVAVALEVGALAGFSPALNQPPIVQEVSAPALAIVDDGTNTLALLSEDGAAHIYALTTDEVLVEGLDGAEGFAALPGGRFAVGYPEQGDIDVVSGE